MSLDVAQHRVKQDIGCSAPMKYVSNLSRRVRSPRASQHNNKHTLNTTTHITIFTNLLPNRVHLRYVLVGRAVKFLVVIHGESKRTSGFNPDDKFCKVLEYPFSLHRKRERSDDLMQLKKQCPVVVTGTTYQCQAASGGASAKRASKLSFPSKGIFGITHE
jgi:hypothetical protein